MFAPPTNHRHHHHQSTVHSQVGSDFESSYNLRRVIFCQLENRTRLPDRPAKPAPRVSLIVLMAPRVSCNQFAFGVALLCIQVTKSPP